VHRWYTLLVVLVLVGCGRPIQLGTPSQVQIQPTQLSGDTALPKITANGVPSAGPTVQSTAELAATAFATAVLEPTVRSETMITVDVPVAATPTSVMVVPLTQLPETTEQRWRAQQQDRQVNDPPRIYVAPISITLWWYDPLTSQSVPIGTINGEFPVQAEFVLRGPQQAALEVPYRINNDFGLTAISDAVRARMQAAGYSQSVEAYVLRTADINPK
jgi:hypothetical protein